MIHHIVLRLGLRANNMSGGMSGPATDAHINGYLTNGWEIKHTQALGVEGDEVLIFYILYLAPEKVKIWEAKQRALAGGNGQPAAEAVVA